MSHRDQFEAALDANPADWTTRRVYADWLEENGDGDLANAQRWMAEVKVCPTITYYTFDGKIVWFVSPGGDFGHFLSRIDAERHVARVIAGVR